MAKEDLRFSEILGKQMVPLQKWTNKLANRSVFSHQSKVADYRYPKGDGPRNWRKCQKTAKWWASSGL